MKKTLSVAMMVLLAATLISCAQTESKSTASPQAPAAKEEKASTLDVQRSSVSTTTAKVEAVDLQTRIVKLRTLEGKPVLISNHGWTDEAFARFIICMWG